MRFAVIAVLVFALAGAAGAVNRSTMPDNPNACIPTDDPQQGTQNGDGATVVTYADATVYYNQAAFLAALQPGYYFDDFAWLGWGTVNGASYTFGPVNGFAYMAAATGGVYSVPGAMSTNSLEDPLVLTFTGNPVTAVGGGFFGTDFDGNPMAGTTTITLNDGTVVQLAYPTVFVGFTSAVPITSLTITVVAGSGLWPTYDNFYVGNELITPVESESWGAVKALFQ